MVQHGDSLWKWKSEGLSKKHTLREKKTNINEMCPQHTHHIRRYHSLSTEYATLQTFLNQVLP